MSRGNAAVKAKRQQTILSLVGRERLASQEEIRARLASLGLDATQSTISRDVEELGLARVHDHDGLRYVVPGNGTAPAPLRCPEAPARGVRALVHAGRSRAGDPHAARRGRRRWPRASTASTCRRSPARSPATTRSSSSAERVSPPRRSSGRSTSIMEADSMKRAVLAYSGGLDTSVTIRWLDGAGVRGRTRSPSTSVSRRTSPRSSSAARRAGAADVRVVDAVDRFAAEFLTRAIKANGLYEGKYPMVSRPRPAADRRRGRRGRARDRRRRRRPRLHRQGERPGAVRGVVRRARAGPRGPRPDPRREHPPREGAGRSPRSGASRSPAIVSSYSVDENLWGRTVECGPLEDPWVAPPEDAFERTASPARSPVGTGGARDRVRARRAGGARRRGPISRSVIRLARGDGRRTYGFGRVDMIENRRVGIKSRELYEVPGALAIIEAHRALEDLTLEREVAHTKPLTRAALGGSGLRRAVVLARCGEAIDAFVDATQEHCHRGGASAVRARRLHRRGAALGALALRPVARDVRRRRRVRPIARRGVRAPLRAAAQGVVGEAGRAPGPGERSARRRRAALGGPVLGASGAGGARARALDRRSTSGSPPHDVGAGVAHVQALADAGLLTTTKRLGLSEALREVGTSIADGTFAFDAADEDVHSAIERAVTDRLGRPGRAPARRAGAVTTWW